MLLELSRDDKGPAGREGRAGCGLQGDAFRLAVTEQELQAAAPPPSGARAETPRRGSGDVHRLLVILISVWVCCDRVE